MFFLVVKLAKVLGIPKASEGWKTNRDFGIIFFLLVIINSYSVRPFLYNLRAQLWYEAFNKVIHCQDTVHLQWCIFWIFAALLWKHFESFLQELYCILSQSLQLPCTKWGSSIWSLTVILIDMINLLSMLNVMVIWEPISIKWIFNVSCAAFRIQRLIITGKKNYGADTSVSPSRTCLLWCQKP